MIVWFLLSAAAQDPALLMREVLSLAGKPAAKWQPVVAAVEALPPAQSNSKALYQVLSRTPGAPAEVRCFGALGAMRAGGPLDATCDAELGPIVALQAASEGLGGKERVPFVLAAAKAEAARVRMFAARAAVFVLSDARAAAIVKNALRTGDSVTVALVAEAFALLKTPKPWLSELAKAADRDGIDDEAMRLLQDAVGDEYELDVAPASMPVALPSVTTNVSAVRYVVDKDGRVIRFAGGLVAIAVTRQSPR